MTLNEDGLANFGQQSNGDDAEPDSSFSITRRYQEAGILVVDGGGIG